MNREEILAKLMNIKPTVGSLVMTYDMGLQFDIMDSTGASTNIGNLGSWPLWKFPRLNQTQIESISSKIKQNTLSVNDFNGPLKVFVQTVVRNYDKVVLSEEFCDIVKYVESENKKDFYIYCDLDKNWEFEIMFFETENEITEEFCSRFQIYSNWEEMSNSELEYYCKLIEEEGEGIPFRTPKIDNAEED